MLSPDHKAQVIQLLLDRICTDMFRVLSAVSPEPLIPAQHKGSEWSIDSMATTTTLSSTNTILHFLQGMHLITIQSANVKPYISRS